MRTTVDLPDELFRAAKVEAAARGETLKDFLTRAVTHELGTAAPPRQSSRRMPLPLIKSKEPGTLRLTNQDIEEIFAQEDIGKVGKSLGAS